MSLVLSPLCHVDPSLESLAGGVQGADSPYPLANPIAENSSALVSQYSASPFF
jgi:hypothetical protein